MTIVPPNAAVLFNRLLARGRLRHLQLLVALADAGSVQRAAALVGMSQPAATQALSDLETLLAVTLFERHSRGVRMTPFGQAVIPVARSTLLALRASAEAVCLLRDGERETLRLGSIPAAASGLLAAVLPDFLAANPGLQVELLEEGMSHLEPELMAGRLHAILCRCPDQLPPAVTFEVLMADEPVILAAPDHPMARRRQIALPELARFPWVLPPVGTPVRTHFDLLWRDQPAQPPLYPLVSTSMSVVQAVMRSAAAVSLVPRSLSRAMTGGDAAVPLAVQLPRAALKPLGLVTPDAPMPRALQELRERLVEAGCRTEG